MIERGAKKVGFIGSKPLVESEVMDRERAYVDLMNEKNMPVRSVNEVILHGDEGRLVKDFMNKYPEVDGVFVSGYSLSQVFYKSAVDSGKVIPEDMQIISYDGEFTQWGVNQITCVEQPIEEMARKIVDLLIKKIRGEKTQTRTVLETRFVLGSTTKK